MIKSMTGYGRREAAYAGGTVVAEIRSVNHRYCEVVVKVPRLLSSLEAECKQLVQAHCQRGRVDVSLSVFGAAGDDRALSLDRSLAKQYHQLLRQLKRELRLDGSIDLALFAGLRDIFTVSDRLAPDRRLHRQAKALLASAAADLDAMRRREGRALAEDLTQRLTIVRTHVRAIHGRAPAVAQEHLARMKGRVEQLLGGGHLDQGRLYQELAIVADRSDVTEELTRLDSHLAQFAESLKSREAVGRRLDFLLQEIGREVNTIGSKANDSEIAARVVELKTELEKIREQVQNVE